ncbi:MAG TPA: NUDIX hydrolase [Bryobacteraceae bacterium]|jgi:ADP-ribose pyrophosphatase YjhB (NUDIX family)|nr:NUDIX hydrolase [Bryobacteraceae bacterium]
MSRRSYPERPILGIGAIVIESGRVLLVKRGREPLKGFWSLPGGVLEVGETLVEGLRREMREETGLEIETLSVVEIFERIMRDASGAAEYHYVLIDYLCRVTGGTLEAGDDVSEACWVERERLGEYRITEGSVPVIEKAFDVAADLLVRPARQ